MGTAHVRPVGIGHVSFGGMVRLIVLWVSYPTEPLVAFVGSIVDGVRFWNISFS